MPETKAFGALIRRRRRELDLTQEELARRIGCARITIRKIEADQLRPSVQMAELLRQHLGIPDGQREGFLRFARGGTLLEFLQPSTPRHNLPAHLTSFLGREHEMAQVRKLLESHRLVTLIGSGGTGKTRLAQQIAADLLEQFPDGVWFVDLAPVSDGALIPQVVFSVFDLSPDRGREPLEVLGSYLAGKSLLIILDNCEHLLADCCRFAQTLLEASPAVKLMATSSEALNLGGEQAFRVPSMAAPDTDHMPPTEQLIQFEAVRLFIERAKLELPDFALTDTNALAVAKICNRLDGIPLAIELAAARIKSMPVDTVVSRLDDRFRLLIGGSRTALPRHQTLRATMDWSFDLLDGPERLLLQRVSVFRGGWMQEAAEAVCAGDGIEQVEIVDLLAILIDKSMLALDEHSRYQMLETLRQYADDKLSESGQGEKLRNRHLSYFMDLAKRAEPEMRGHNQVIWLDRLEAEIDNLRLALGWAQERDAEVFLRLATTAYRFWDLRGHTIEGFTWLTAALALTEGMPTTARGRALVRAGNMAWNLEDFKQTGQLAQEAFALGEALGDKETIAWALSLQGGAALEQNLPQAGLAFLERALALFREMGEHGMVGSVLVQLGTEPANRNDLASARSFMEQALQETRISGDGRRIADALGALGGVALAEGDTVEAAGLFEQRLTLAREMGDKDQATEALIELGRAALFREDYPRAGQLLSQALKLCQDTGTKASIAWTLLEMGKLAWAQDDLQGFEDRLDQALVIGRQLDLNEVKAYALYYLGQAARLRGYGVLAHARFSEALTFFALSERVGYRLCLEGFGAVGLEQGKAGRAARLYAAGRKFQGWAWGRDNYPFMERERERLITEACSQLGEEAFNAAWAEGEAMSEGEVLAYAREEKE